MTTDTARGDGNGRPPRSDERAYAVTFGRTLVEGDPVDEGLTFPADSPTLDALAEATSPLISNPPLGEFGAALISSEETGGEYARALAITPPGAQGPAEHYHPGYAESFEVVEGEFVFEIEGDPRTLTAGKSVTVEAGMPHTFRNESESYATCVIESVRIGSARFRESPTENPARTRFQ